MPSIDDILNGLGVESSDQAEKTASDKSQTESEIEKQAKKLGLIGEETNEKTASISNDGGKMNLEDLYNEAFNSEEVTKVAHAGLDYDNEDEQVKVAQGEIAGEEFSEGLNARLLAHTVKLAADMDQPDSEATKDIQSGGGVIPGAKTKNPQLPVQKNRHGEADDTAIDTAPDYYDLEGMDGAVAKAKLESALDRGNVSDVSHKTVNVDQDESEMPEGGSQKTAGLRLRDLNRAQFELLQTDFPEEMMKEARAIVAEETEKVAELQGQAESCYDYGAEMAMQKIAEMEEAQKAKAKKEEDEEDEDEKSEEEKTASAMGKFVLEGYWDTMMEKGAEYYGDENIYIEELIKEANLLQKGKKVYKSLKGKAGDLKKSIEDYYDPRAIKAKSHITRKQKMMKDMKGNVMGDASKRRSKLEALKKKKGKGYEMKGSKALQTARARRRNTAIAGGTALGLGAGGTGYALGRD